METNENLDKLQEEVKEPYKKPEIEIIEMETESSILQGSAGDFKPGGGWRN